MKATGLVRKVDNLGRVVLPSELRRTMHISIGDPVEFYTEGNGVFIKKYDTVGCVDQLLDNVESGIRLLCNLIPGNQYEALLIKADEMREIIKPGKN